LVILSSLTSALAVTAPSVSAKAMTNPCLQTMNNLPERLLVAPQRFEDNGFGSAAAQAPWDVREA
jgi:hypothetical protein